MPTGYTADLYDGKDVSFEDFALDCARAFGALASLRDDTNAEIPDEFKVDDYYVRKVEESTAELEKAKQMTDEEFAAEAEKDFLAKKESLTGLLEKNKDLRARYESMLEQVKEWTPPTEDHVELKNFMISQLEDSIKFDASTDYYEKELAELSVESIEEAKVRIISGLEWHVNYGNEQLEKQEIVMKDRSEWVSDLRKSLKK